MGMCCILMYFAAICCTTVISKNVNYIDDAEVEEMYGSLSKSLWYPSLGVASLSCHQLPSNLLSPSPTVVHPLLPVTVFNPQTINCYGCRNSRKSDTVCPLAALVDRVNFLMPSGIRRHHTFVKAHSICAVDLFPHPDDPSPKASQKRGS